MAGLGSGLLAYGAFPPADVGALAFVALVPLALVFRAASLQGILAGFTLFSVTFFGLLLTWIGEVTFLGYIAVIPALTVFFVGLPLGAAKVRRRIPGWPSWLLFALSLLAADYLRTKFPLGGFPWGGLGYSQHDNLPILRLAAYTGVWGVSFILLLVNSLLAEGIHVLAARLPRRRLARWVVPAVALAMFPALLPPADYPDGGRARVAMIQGNVPEGTIDPHADDMQVLQNHINLSRTIAGRPPSLVVWPEGALDRDPLLDARVEDALIAIIREVGAPFVVGGWARRPDGSNRNATLFFNAEGRLLDIYAKRKLVPFGEWAPLRPLLQPFVKGIRRIKMDLTPGAEATVFSLPQGKFASVICYESTYPELVRSLVRNGARFLIVSTNNSSFGRSAASDQHLIFSQLRAAEHRMWLAHTGVSGISAVVAPDGRIMERSKLFEPAVMVPSLRFARGLTPYARWGDWLPLAGLLNLAALVIASLVRTYGPKRHL